MRTFSMYQEMIVPYVGQLVTALTEKIIAVAKNPSKPHFNHYMFESLSLAIKITCKANPSAVTTFENGLFPPFQQILQQDVQEFMPYVFQLLSMLLELHSDNVPEPYMALFPHLLLPVLWERLGNIPPLVRLLQAYVEKGAKQIENERVTGLLGVFQKLIASKSNDHQGFYLLQSIIQYMPGEIFAQYGKQIFILLFQRLQSSKTTKYVKNLLVLFSFFVLHKGAQQLVEAIEAIQTKMFGMVVEKLFVTDVRRVSGSTERKMCAVGIIKLLTETPVLLSPDYEKLWPQLLQALLCLFELPEDSTVPDDEHFIEIEDTPGYQTAYSQLVFAGKAVADPCAEVADPKVHLARKLFELSQKHPNKLGPLISSSIEPQAVQYLQQYCASAGVTLV